MIAFNIACNIVQGRDDVGDLCGPITGHRSYRVKRTVGAGANAPSTCQGSCGGAMPITVFGVVGAIEGPPAGNDSAASTVCSQERSVIGLYPSINQINMNPHSSVRAAVVAIQGQSRLVDAIKMPGWTDLIGSLTNGYVISDIVVQAHLHILVSCIQGWIY